MESQSMEIKKLSKNDLLILMADMNHVKHSLERFEEKEIDFLDILSSLIQKSHFHTVLEEYFEQSMIFEIVDVFIKKWKKDVILF